MASSSDAAGITVNRRDIRLGGEGIMGNTPPGYCVRSDICVSQKKKFCATQLTSGLPGKEP
jgi:hypothetical protein